MRRVFVVVPAAVGIVAVALAAGVVWRVWSPLPQVSGTARLPGLAASVTVLRDARGIPHIRAESEVDAFAVLGWVHAQDRLWQMEFQRRLAAGRLAEILGEAALDTDRLFRTIGLAHVASETWARTTGEPRAFIEAYVRGVNAFLEAHRGRRLPVEFALLGVEPEPWRPEHVIGWSKVLAWMLATDWRDELLRTRVAARVGEAGAAVLMPARTAGTPVIVPDGPVTTSPEPLLPVEDTVRPPADPWLVALAERIDRALPVMSAAASNNWVVSGARTASGSPLLANDPHLGAQLPSIWYLAHLTGGRLDAIGATLPGSPGVVIGHNGRIAWGVTNLMADVQDLFVERLNPRQEAEYDGVWEPLTLRHEVIRVKGGRDVPLVVRASRHGPLISDLFDEVQDGRALSLRWTGHDVDDQTIGAFLRVGLARTWDEFTVALAGFHGPPQNFVYADVDGNIGYVAPGALPVRPRNQGTWPSPGWSSEHAWQGYHPAVAWPRIYNPVRGFVATANNPPFPDDAGPAISSSWEPGYRAARVSELLETAGPLSVADVSAMQRDVVSLQARTLLPWLRRAAPPDEPARLALDRLRGWDGTMAPDSAEAAIYAAWYDALVDVLFEDELGPGLHRDWRIRAYLPAKALHGLVLSPDDRWCDDVRTPEVEECEEMFGRALSLGLERMAARQGSADPAHWVWGRANVVDFPHLPLSGAPWLGRLFGRTAEVGGDAATVSPVMRLATGTFVASYRQVVDLADLDRSVFSLTLGQSGQWGSAQYSDQLPYWQRGESLPMPFSRAAVDAVVTARLVLEP